MNQLGKRKTGNYFPSLLSDFFEADRLWSRSWPLRETESSVPAVNIKDKPNHYEIELAAPGFKKGDFKIDVDDSLLTINAERKEEKSEEKDNFTRKEFSYSSFSRSFTLPSNVFSDKIDAKYNDGILNLCIPKKEEATLSKKKEIKVV